MNQFGLRTNQIYLFDFQIGATVLISQSYDGSGAGNDSSDFPTLSPDGHFVAYRSAASNLVPNDGNGVPDIFLYDRLNGSTMLVSASRFGSASADNRSLMPVFSGDSQTLMFESWASDLLPNDFNNNVDVFAFSLYSSATIPAFAATIFPAISSGPRCALSWPVMPGKTYHVEFKNSLGDALWQQLNGHLTVAGDRGYLQDGGAAQRFYRVVSP